MPVVVLVVVRVRDSMVSAWPFDGDGDVNLLAGT